MVDSDGVGYRVRTPVGRFYDQVVLRHPWLISLIMLASVFAMAMQIPNFKLDASADSLVLESDKDLYYFQLVTRRYGSENFLFITYEPESDPFSPQTFKQLSTLKTQLETLPRVKSVITILDVPLLKQPDQSGFGSLLELKTLRDENVDIKEARLELVDSPIYRDLLISRDGELLALQVNLIENEKYQHLLRRRNDLRATRIVRELSADEQLELQLVTEEVRAMTATEMDVLQQDIEAIREILYRHEGAKVHLGGLPMIAADLIRFVENDLQVFGTGVFLFLITVLTIIFRKLRWVVLPLLCCTVTGIIMLGLLALLDWRPTVVSSNFISLLLIITMSLAIHLVVRYREIIAEYPHCDHLTAIFLTVSTMARPCLYTSLTTMVAFGSLYVSGIRPVIDFGIMMTVGVGVALVVTFLVFPTSLALLRKGGEDKRPKDGSAYTERLAVFTLEHGHFILGAALLLVLLSGVGLTKLRVENRFIDYFRESTEIYQGMKLIDERLGGTTPLDVVLDAEGLDPFAVSPTQPIVPEPTSSSEEQPLESMFDEYEDENDLNTKEEDLDEFSDLDWEFEDSAEINNATTANDYWFTTSQLDRVVQLHEHLESLPETGKVLSVATLMKLGRDLKGGEPLSAFDLNFMRNKLPDDIQSVLLKPYLSDDGNQIRISMRVMESDPNLKREVLINKIRDYLTNEMGLQEEQIHFTNMIVLYNNLLQSLFKSQILTLGFVFLSILLMFAFLFNSVFIAAVAILPNLLTAALVLGAMGWLNIPLDIMTITIAAISVGIGVDHTIHYIHRFRQEFPKDYQYETTIKRCHGSIGKAIFYTSITIILGFSILVLSNFIPTIYFGLFTGAAMLFSLLAALTLLPRLLILFKPFRVKRLDGIG